MPPDWDLEADVVVVGFGAAGACAALEAAAAGCSVLILDRFGGGGATALSGGVVYAGGGTPQQRAAGVTDTPGAMLGYLRTEVGDAVPETTLREFCDGSVAMLAWLESHGVPFEGSLCPDKTSYPTNRHYLYYSGSELSAASAPEAPAPEAGTGPPAPRGHRTRGRGTSGGLLYARLAAAVRDAGARVLDPDRRPPAGHRPERPRDRRGVPVSARCARRGPAGPPRPAPLVGQAVPVRAQARPGPAPAGRVAGAALRAPAPDRGRARRGARGGRIRRQPGDAARPRAVRPWRPAAGHAGRRWQRHPPRHQGRGRDRVPGPGVGLAVPQPAARPARRRPGRPRRASGCATSPATAPPSATRSSGTAAGPGC